MTEEIENGTVIEASDGKETVGGPTVSVTAVSDGDEGEDEAELAHHERGKPTSDTAGKEYVASTGSEDAEAVPDTDADDISANSEQNEADCADADDADASAESSADLSTDLYELVKLFPHIRRFSDISGIPGAKRYAELRAAGLSPEEAYLAVNGREELAKREESERIQRGQKELSHVTAAVHGGSTPRRLMTEAQRRAARATIGTDISDAELDMLWKKVYGEDA